MPRDTSEPFAVLGPREPDARSSEASPVSVFASAVAVGMSIKRVHQHLTVSHGVGDGRELFRRPRMVAYHSFYPFLALGSRRGSQKVTEIRYVLLDAHP